ncbi:MAG: response regulator [Clostridiales bacterium]|jgi:signal transduction histidine kinase/DNA-binding response OmpR family regulator/HPt (histidine-containing phosphotransfer) domain-containing protein|nr:response regulator [Clostridiales bacterium]
MTASQILDNIDACVCVTDPETYRILYVNETMSALYAPRRLVGELCWEALQEGGDGPCVFCPCDKLRGDPGAAVTWEAWSPKTHRLYRNTSRLADWGEGGPRAHIKHAVDITDIKKLTEKSDKAKNDFMSRMSHEILTPMNAIMGMSRIASATDDLFKIKNCLMKIDDASKQLLGIINGILDMSRLEDGRLELVHDDFNLERMLMETCGEVAALANEKAQDLQVVIDRDVPVTLRSDEHRLSQILTHLLTNAIKFTPPRGKIRLQAAFLGKRGGGRAELSFSVADDGIGISESEQARLFDAFEQVNGTQSRKYGGLGLGLTICRSLARLLGGDIDVRSAPGKGSTFTFRVVTETAEGGAANMEIRNPAHRALRILFADDDADTREYFKLLMRECQVPTKCVESGFEALESMERALRAHKPYTILFVDWRMPHMDGIETAKQFRKRFGDAAAIVLVAGIEWDLIERASAEAGIRHFLPKPLFASSIVDRINEIVGLPERRSRAGVSVGAGVSGGVGGPPDFSSKLILLVDDIQINRDILVAFLEDTGVAFDHAANGLEAVNKFKGRPAAYDLILMDLHMPEMDGYEASIHIRSLGHPRAKQIPILAMTAEVFEKDITRCRQVGMNGHLRKPVMEDKLIECLSRFLLGGAARRKGGGDGDAEFVSNARSPIGVSVDLPTDTSANFADTSADIPAGASTDLRPGMSTDLQTDASVGRGTSAVPDPNDYLPYIDLRLAMQKLHNNQKLYAAMLVNIRHNPLFDALVAALRANDLSAIGDLVRTLMGIAGNLSLSEISDALTQIETMTKRRIMPHELIDRYAAAVDRTFERLDGLIEALDRGEYH